MLCLARQQRFHVAQQSQSSCRRRSCGQPRGLVTRAAASRSPDASRQAPSRGPQRLGAAALDPGSGAGGTPGDLAAAVAAAARGVASPPSAKGGTILGAVALITGSTVGAGMLALPAVTAPAGIVPTSAGLLAIWGLLTLDALLIAEVNLAALAARRSSRAASGEAAGADTGGFGGAEGIVTLRQMAEFSLGKAGKGLTVVYLALAYSLLTAYCTKAAEVLDYFSGGSLPPLAGAALFCGAIGGLLYKEGTRTIDSLNQGLTSVLLALFAVILTAGAAQSSLPGALAAGVPGLQALGPCNWGALEPAVPIMFLALVYHDLVPVIVSYLGGDRRAIRTAIVLGSLVPLTMFLSWEAVALSILPAGLTEIASGGATLTGSGFLEASYLPAGAAGVPAAAAALLPAVALPAADAGLHAVSYVDDSVAALPAALDPLQVFVRRSSPLVGSVVQSFSLLAVMTSFIGITLSTSETLRTEVPPLLHEMGKLLRRSGGADVSAATMSCDYDELACLASSGPSAGAGCSAGWASAEGAVEQEEWEEEEEAPAVGKQGMLGGVVGDPRALALLLTLCPPLAMAAANPDSFLGALEIAGAYFMTLLYGILPPLMAWQLRAKLKGKAAAAAALPAAAQAAALPPAEGEAGQVQAAAGKAAAGVELLQQQWQAQQGAHHGPQQAQQQPWWRLQNEEMVPGGLPVLAGLFTAACTIEVSRLAIDAGHLANGPGRVMVQEAVEAALRSPVAASEAMMALLQLTPL